jgi:hypothetical protein
MTDAHHPFHLHGFSIQPLDFTKTASPTYTFPYREFRDNIDVPAPVHDAASVSALDDRYVMDGHDSSAAHSVAGCSTATSSFTRHSG